MQLPSYKANAVVKAVDKDNNATAESPEGQMQVHNDVEYVKGHPVIRTGQHSDSLFDNTTRWNYADLCRC